MTDILLIAGTRPEVIKLGPVGAELTRLGVDWRPLLTGQHTTLLAGSPTDTDFAGSDSLGLASDGDVARWMASAQHALCEALGRLQPKIVVVQGDTMSVHAAAEAAKLAGVPVAHVEAGVRSHNLANPWPEETTRIAVTQIARWHYAPTPTAFVNLLAERVPSSTVRVTGNTVVTALARYTDARPQAVPQPLVVVTLHRREIQHADIAQALYQAIVRLARNYPHLRFVWPMHPAFERCVVRHGDEPDNLEALPPTPYKEFAELVASATAVVTDSGGLVEEAATLGVPTLIVRATNDRPEAVDVGIAQRCDPTADALTGMFTRVLGLARRPSWVFGEVEAAQLVARHLASVL